MSVAVINARAVGNEAHFNGRASAVVGLVVEGAAVVWRATAHIAIVVHDRSCTEFEARSIRRGIVVFDDVNNCSAARAARARKLMVGEGDAGTRRSVSLHRRAAQAIRPWTPYLRAITQPFGCDDAKHDNAGNVIEDREPRPKLAAALFIVAPAGENDDPDENTEADMPKRVNRHPPPAIRLTILYFPAALDGRVEVLGDAVPRDRRREEKAHEEHHAEAAEAAVLEAALLEVRRLAHVHAEVTEAGDDHKAHHERPYPREHVEAKRHKVFARRRLRRRRRR